MGIQQKIDIESLVARYKPELYWHLSHTTSLTKQEIEETVMDALLKSIRAYDQYDNKYAFSTWLYHIAINCATDRMRRNNQKKRIKTQPLEDLHYNTICRAEYNRGERNLLSELQKHNKKRVRKAVQELPYQARRMVVLRYFFGFDYNTVAESIGCPLGTVKATINRAKSILKIKLEHGGPKN